MNTVLNALNWRYAVKKFDTKKLPQEKVDLLLESLRLSASSYGLQAWKFILVETPETRERLVAASWNQAQVKDASHLIVFARPDDVSEMDVHKFITKISEERGVAESELEGYSQLMKSAITSRSKEEIAEWLSKQLYLALGTLLTTAAIEGIDACPMEGFQPEMYDEILGLKEHGLRSVVVCPIGYRAQDDTHQHLKKVRFEKEDVTLVL